MSQLPPLLLERLKRRGIIKKAGDSTQAHEKRPKSQSSTTKQANPTYGIECDPDHEEIIAEDYSESSDEDELPSKDTDISTSTEAERGDVSKDEDTENSSEGGDISTDEQLEGSVLGCPNKYNIYHECSKFCVDHYSSPDSVLPTLEQRKQLALVLRDCPLPNEWQVVYDPGVKTFYFWNIVTNLVSWLPPIMSGYVSMSADEIRKSMRT